MSYEREQDIIFQEMEARAAEDRFFERVVARCRRHLVQTADRSAALQIAIDAQYRRSRDEEDALAFMFRVKKHMRESGDKV